MKQKFIKSMILLTIIFMDLLAGMEFDLFVPSFPELQSHFNLTPFWVEALLSINFFGYCIGLFFVGGMADRYGRKPMIISGLIIFIIGSILCLSAPSYVFLLSGRFLQGIGVAAPAVLSFLIIADSYPLKKQQSLLAMMNGLMNVSVAAAPIIGSYVTLYFNWQGNFVALLALGLITLIMTTIFVPKYKLPEHKESFLFRGYTPILQTKPLLLLIVSIVFMIVPYWIFVGMSPLLYMEDLGVSLAHFGYYQGSLAFIFALGCIYYGLIINKHDQNKVLHLSGQVMFFGTIMVVLVAFMDSRSPLLITLALIPFTIGQIIPSTILYPLCLNYLPKAKGRVAASIQAGRLVLSALALQLAGYYYQGSFRNIGIIIGSFMLLAVIFHFIVLKNRELKRHIC